MHKKSVLQTLNFVFAFTFFQKVKNNFAILKNSMCFSLFCLYIRFRSNLNIFSKINGLLHEIVWKISDA